MSIIEISEIIKKFCAEGEFVSAAPFGSGHINNTYLVNMKREDGTTVDYVLQRINKNVFKNPEQVMQNISKRP